MKTVVVSLILPLGMVIVEVLIEYLNVVDEKNSLKI